MNIQEQVYTDRRDVLINDFQEATKTGKGIKQTCKRLIRFAEDVLNDTDTTHVQKLNAMILKITTYEFMLQEIPRTGKRK
jgi:transcription termination factor NusB